MRQSKNPRILVVEDDSQMRASMHALLSAHGFDVNTQTDLSGARNSIHGEPYDVALLDIGLKGQCGLSLMDDFVNCRMDTRVIVVTGQHSERYAITALKKGATDYLKKPFEPDELIESVNTVLKRQWEERKLKLLKHTVKASSVAIAVGASEGDIVYANAAYRQLTGTEEKAGSQLSADPNADGGGVVIDEHIRQTLKTGVPWKGRAELNRVQDRPLTVCKRVDPIPEKIGGQRYGVALLSDITAQVKKELAVANSRERYRKVIDSQPDHLYRLNSDLLFTFVNQTYASFMRKTPYSMIGQPITDVVSESTLPLLLEALTSIRSEARPIEIEFMVSADGNTEHWQEWRFEGIYNNDGQLTEFQGVGRDVAGDRRVAREIENNREKFRNLAELTSDWLWEVDCKGLFSYTNPVVYNLLGYTPEEVLGKSAFSFMPQQESLRLQALFEHALAAGQPLKNIESINRCKDGSRVTLEISGVPIHDETGGIIGYRGINRDVSVRKDNETRLRKESESLRKSLARVKRLSGILPICSSCKKIRDETGCWVQIEKFIENNSDAEFSHGVCPECAHKLYPELYE